MTAISEMLIQDRRKLLRILPALPDAWPDGNVKGMLCRGGFQVDIEWQQSRSTQVKILSRHGGQCRVKVFCGRDRFTIEHDNTTEQILADNGILEFATDPKTTYTIKPA